MKPNRLIYNSTVSRHSTLSIDLEIVSRCGFDGYEVAPGKLRDFLAAGYGEDELSARLAAVDVTGVGFIKDLERDIRQEPALQAEAREVFDLARIAGAKGVQVLTGPLELQAVQDHARGRTSTLYSGLLGHSREDQLNVTARALAGLADVAAESGLLIYLEALAWAPLNRLADQQELIVRAERENIRLVVDYWHCYASGDTPDDVAKLDRRLIYGVHVCDSLANPGGIPNEVIMRDVPSGSGVLNLQDWTDAVKATGYDDWWSCESFCRRQQQDNSFAQAAFLLEQMRDLVGV